MVYNPHYLFILLFTQVTLSLCLSEPLGQNSAVSEVTLVLKGLSHFDSGLWMRLSAWSLFRDIFDRINGKKELEIYMRHKSCILPHIFGVCSLVCVLVPFHFSPVGTFSGGYTEFAILASWGSSGIFPTTHSLGCYCGLIICFLPGNASGKHYVSSFL